MTQERMQVSKRPFVESTFYYCLLGVLSLVAPVIVFNINEIIWLKNKDAVFGAGLACIIYEALLFIDTRRYIRFLRSIGDIPYLRWNQHLNFWLGFAFSLSSEMLVIVFTVAWYEHVFSVIVCGLLLGVVLFIVIADIKRRKSLKRYLARKF